MRLISWNIAHRPEAWRMLLDSGADVALLQEACQPPSEVATRLELDGAKWATAGAGERPWRTAIVQLSDAVKVEWLELRPLCEASEGEFPVSRPGTLAAANVTGSDGLQFTAVSTYGLWERPHAATGSGWIFADAAVHRLISDLSVFVGSQTGHRVLAAGEPRRGVGTERPLPNRHRHHLTSRPGAIAGHWTASRKQQGLHDRWGDEIRGRLWQYPP